MKEGVLGLDVGLSGVRAAVVDTEGTLLATARRRHRHAHIADGVAEHHPRDWLDGVAAAGREATARAPDAELIGVGTAALGPAPVLVDAKLEPLTRAPLFSLDRRAEPQRRHMTEGLGAAESAATLDNPLPKLEWWRQNEPALAAHAAWALDATGFLVASLTGVPVMDAVTAADYALPGIEPAFPVPAPIDPFAVAGEVSAAAAERLGVTPGLPVVAGSYDSFVDVAAAGVRRPGDAAIVLGSTMIVCRATASAHRLDGLGTSAYPGDGVLLGGWSLAGGLVLDWFCEQLAGGRSPDDLAAAAAGTESKGVVALPYLAGERTPLWDLSLRGALLGLGLGTRPEHVYRALVDSLALVVRDHTDRIDQALGPCRTWHVTGGGARNPLWLEATADAVGARLDVAPDAGEAVGPALIALRALGVDPVRPPAMTVEPNPDGMRRFESLLPIFRGLPTALEALR